MPYSAFIAPSTDYSHRALEELRVAVKEAKVASVESFF